ncbi:MAG: redoxin domain-containing protein [SAR202 cluster bacterium]|jgi:thiol-disulfide isomerase/thioredoxin|nr:redoxin domain-containing protein [SAR202 cluster bacterium]|tara:strand:+ start:874 stop:2244 length:1371 start_codon:yes stop_codon:yes gene_type:complete
MTRRWFSRNPSYWLTGVFLAIVFAAAACSGTVSDNSTEPVSEASAGTSPQPAATLLPPQIAASASPTTVATAEPEPTSTAAPTGAPPLPTAAPVKTGDAPELEDTGNWINSEPFTLAEQRERGDVVLIDFWTYTCVNCIRTLPFLREWHSKYADRGLVILGVHTPEFEFEKILENVQDAVAEFDLEYAVVQDNDFGTWNAFSNRFWPAKYLIDVQGDIRYEHFGEGGYDETESQIRELLVEAGHDISGIPAGTDPGPQVDSSVDRSSAVTSPTRELYAGYKRNIGALRSQNTPPYVHHVEYFEEFDVDTQYSDPGEHDNHFMYLEGLWRNEAENLLHARETSEYDDYIAVKFYGASVNAVMAPIKGTPLRVKVTVDGGPVGLDQAGADIVHDPDGSSFVEVDSSRMYFIISQERFSSGELQLSSNSPEFALFAFTFGAYEGGEPDVSSNGSADDGS